MKLKEYFHAIELETDLCIGCTRCVRICPTLAIRVRNGKAKIDPNRCIDCGECVNTCPVEAIFYKSDPVDDIYKYKYRIAIISASYIGQFGEDYGYENAVKALYHIGFDKVAEQAMITNVTTDIIRNYIEEHPRIRPVLSSNCPAVVRLVQVRFPSLLSNLLHIESPMSMLAKYYREQTMKEKGLRSEDIGVFLIVSSPSQVTAVHQPEGAYKHLQDGAIAIRDVYAKAQTLLKEVKNDNRPIETYANGPNWAISGMEAEHIQNDKITALAVSGIHNVIEILSKIESHQLDQYDYIELRNCTLGCVGGGLNIENPFIAATRIKQFMKKAIPKKIDSSYFFKLYKEGFFDVLPLEPRSIMNLDKDIKQAIAKMKKINEIVKELPGLDCGVCGSPTCKALAEDIVQGTASLKDCLVRSREKK